MGKALSVFGQQRVFFSQCFFRIDWKRIVTLGLIAFIIFVVYFSQTASAISVVVNAPNGGETWLQGTTHNIDFNFIGTNYKDDINANLYYSKISGTRQNTIKQDLNIANYKDVNKLDEWNVTYWASSAGTFTTETTTTIDGKAFKCVSLAIEHNCIPYTDILLPVGINLTGYTTKGKIIFYIDTNELLSGLWLRIGSTNANWKGWQSGLNTQVTTTNQFNKITMDINAPTNSGGTIDWTNIKYIYIYALATNTKDVNMVFDAIGAINSECTSTNYDGNALKNNNCTYSWTLPASGDLNNLYVDVNVSNGTSTSQDSSDAPFNFSGLNITIYDETTLTKIQPDTFTIDGNNWLPFCSSGTCIISYDKNISDGNVLVQIGKTGYGTRDFNISLDLNINNTINTTLTSSTNAKNINFKFYAADKTTILNNYQITAKTPQNYWAGKQTTNSAGEITFYLDSNKAGNYSFDLNGANNYHYLPVLLTINIPKDETDFSAISPYNITLANLTISQDHNGLTGNFDFNIFGNTTSFYSLLVGDANAGNYLQRNLLLRQTGSATTLSVQPYLVPITSGITSTIYAFDPITKSALQNIIVILQKDFNAVKTNVFSNLTDSAGTVSISWVYLQDYNLLFYYPTTNNLVLAGRVEPKSLTYYVYLDLNFVPFSTPNITITDINFSGSSSVQENASGNIKFDQNISGAGISSITIEITQGGTALTGSPFTPAVTSPRTSANQTFNIVADAVDKQKEITIKITITKTDGKTITKYKSYFIIGYGQTSLVGNLANLKNDIGETGAMFLALLISILVVGGLTKGLAFGAAPASILGLVSLGFFAYLTWISAELFILLALAGFVGFFLTRREND